MTRSELEELVLGCHLEGINSIYVSLAYFSQIKSAMRIFDPRTTLIRVHSQKGEDILFIGFYEELDAAEELGKLLKNKQKANFTDAWNNSSFKFNF